MRTMTTQRLVSRLLAELRPRVGDLQAVQQVIEAVIGDGVPWDHVLLALSNVAFWKYKATRRGKRVAYARVHVLHDAMEGERGKRKAREALAELRNGREDFEE